MLVKAADVVDTLRLLIPGFVALKAYYLLGLRTKRTDAEWVLWSILFSVPVTAMASLIHSEDDNRRLAWALALAAAGGGVLGIAYTQLARRIPAVRPLTAVRAWDAALARSRWMQFWLKNGSVWLGRPEMLASSAETDDLDVYLVNVHLVDPSTGQKSQLDGVEGLLISRTEMCAVAVFEK